MNYCNSLEKLLESVSDFSRWEEEVAKLVNLSGCRFSKELLEAIDKHLAKERDKELRLVGYRRRTLVCRFGQVRVKRRLYKDREGNYHFLLRARATGFAKRKGVSPSVASLATTLVAYLPYHK